MAADKESRKQSKSMKSSSANGEMEASATPIENARVGASNASSRQGSPRTDEASIANASTASSRRRFSFRPKLSRKRSTSSSDPQPVNAAASKKNNRRSAKDNKKNNSTTTRTASESVSLPDSSREPIVTKITETEKESADLPCQVAAEQNSTAPVASSIMDSSREVIVSSEQRSQISVSAASNGHEEPSVVAAVAAEEQASEEQAPREKERGASYVGEDEPWSLDEVNKVVDLWKLPDKEKEQLIALGKRLQDIDHWKNVPDTVIRFMKARPKSLNAAETMFRNMVQWRIDNQVDTILEDYEPPRQIRDGIPGAILVDYDLDGDPIYAERIGAADSPTMARRFGAEHLIKHAIWIRETISKGAWIPDYERRTGRPPHQILVVEDLHGLSTAHLDRELLSAFQAITRLDQDNYPEAAKKIINVNAPFIFRLAWSLVKHFFDANVAAKMVFTGPGNTENVLREYVDLKVLPKEFTGEGEGRAVEGQNQNFKGGPLPPEGPEMASGRRKETASDSESSYASPISPVRSVARSRGTEDGDSISVISEQSVFSWKAPVRTFIKEKERKRDVAKQQEIREVREMAAQRIQPKERSPSQQERLGRLREAKTRRATKAWDDPSSPHNFDAIIERENKKKLAHWSEKATDHLQTHDKRTRFIVMAILLVSLSLLLHPELLHFVLGVDLTGGAAASWREGLLQGAGLLVYTLFVAVVHFVTCDVSLVYAYNSLQLGSRTGKEVKKFYSEKVRLVVAATSFGIYALSFGKAFARVTLSILIENTSLLLERTSKWVMSAFVKISEVIDAEETQLCVVEDFNHTVGNQTDDFCTSRSAASEAAHQVAESAQRAAENAEKKISSWLDNLYDSLVVGSVDEAMASWRSDAFQTARLFFSYTAVFLLVFLVLFNYTASSALARKTTPNKHEEKQVENAQQDPEPEISLAPQATSEEQRVGEPATRFEDAQSTTSTLSSSPSGKRKRKGFRLLKGRHRTNLGVVRESDE